ncbi:tRNA pseudouridine synthase A [Georgenia muralis]|uniref:tRNA pseudouridine synthase A n=1 Tax=Georgenia muralis TaxID=154117 RepID=UPI001FE56208|nr:tRNA pseudouridine synthase A [Georgenia muralis]
MRLDLAYDGTAFAGWATQPGLRTVQGVLEEALTTVLRLDRPARLTVAGRTDAGVHARGQVAHVDVPPAAWQALPGRGDRPPGEALVARLAGVLGRGGTPRGAADVVVRRASLAPAGFDARFGALWRRYAYRIADGVAGRDPLRRAEVLWHPRPLDAAAMDEAAGRLVGEHDFAAYCRPREGATTIRTLQAFGFHRVGAGGAEGRVREGGGPDEDLVVATVRADAFCHSMVRALVGACLAVGEGRRDPGWPAEVLAAGRRDPGVTVAAAHGLTLEEVAYPPDAGLAARVAEARNVRRLMLPR